MFDKILFAPGLYCNEEEIKLFGIVWDKDLFPSRKEYIWAIETKLEKSILRSFENFILESYSEYELAELISNYTFGLTSSLGVEVLQGDFQRKLHETLEHYWAMTGLEASSMYVDKPRTLASQLMDHDHFYGMISDFYERIEVLKNGHSIEKYYLEAERIEEGGRLDAYSIVTFNYDYCSLVFAGFFDLSVIVYEKID